MRLPHRVKCVCVEHGLLLAKADARIQHCKCRLFRRAAFGHSLVVALHLPCSIFGNGGVPLLQLSPAEDMALTCQYLPRPVNRK